MLFIPSETNCREIIALKLRTYDLSLRLSLSLSVPFASVPLMSLPRPPLPLSVTSLRVIPLIVVVSPSLYLHSRSRLSASSSSSSWPRLEAPDPLLCCWAPGPQPLQARAREAWSSQASSGSAVALTCWSVSHSCFQVKKNKKKKVCIHVCYTKTLPLK